MIRPRSRSIQFRLTAAYTALLAATFAVIGVGTWLALSHSILETADRELHSRLTDLRHYFDSFTPNDLLHLEDEFKEESLLTQATANVRICDAQGHLLFQTPGAEPWPHETASGSQLPQNGRIHTIRVRHHQLIRILIAPVRVGIAEIGLPIDEFEEVKSGFLWLLALGSPSLLLLAWLGGFWMSGRALRPVLEISSAAARINAEDLAARLPGNQSGDELDQLSGVLNSMLERIESSFRRITQFTADASHELRTPIAIIQTTAELMQSRSRTEAEQTRAWNMVLTETGRTSLLIANLLTLARADAGEAALHQQPVGIAEVVRLAVDEMRVLADAKGLQVSVEETGPCVIHADADALRRAICILLDNSIKFTDAPGSINVSIQGAKVIIADTGVGIAPEDLPLIFERFYRTSKDRSRKTGGAGLGLSIAQEIIEQHSCKIHVESKLGQGSAFTLDLSNAASQNDQRQN